MTTPDFRALCAELVKAWDTTADFDFNDFGHAAADIVTRARAALAEPVGEVPTDQELDRLLYYEFTTSTGHGERQDVMGFARAVLARWGHLTPPAPEVGEVAELVEWLEAQAIVYEDYLQSRSGSKRLTRAATLLQQLSAPAPAVVPLR
jgi:hypothetical protein